MDDLITFNGRFLDRESGYSVLVDDDGRVAYAYLLDPNNAIVGDVWLYNRGITPSESEWKDSTKMPFANPIDFVKKDRAFITIRGLSEINLRWGKTNVGIKVSVFIRNELFAILIEGEKPGRSVLAEKNGPLARVLEEL